MLKDGLLLVLLATSISAAPVVVRDSDKPDHQGPTVDHTATRSAWVSSYNKKPAHEGPTVDHTATRSAWVSSYNKRPSHEGPTVDHTATRSAWVSSYNKRPAHQDIHSHSPGVHAWLPSGPGYLNLEDYDIPHTNWLAVPMSSHGPSSTFWSSIRRFFAGRV